MSETSLVVVVVVTDPLSVVLGWATLFLMLVFQRKIPPMTNKMIMTIELISAPFDFCSIFYLFINPDAPAQGWGNRDPDFMSGSNNY